MRKYKPKKIMIERGCENDSLTQAICENLPGVSRELFNDGDETFTGGKILIIRNFKGEFFKLCPGSPNVICCNYHVLQNAENCHLNCTYCILPDYFRSDAVTIYSNTEDMFNEVDKKLKENPGGFYRIGTGEFSDSLAFDDITGFSKVIVPFFSRFDNVLLELKTKSTMINNLLELDHGGRTVVSWSVNPDEVIYNEEQLSPLLEERLSSAQTCAGKGYRIGLHFDPVLYYKGWEENYKLAVEKIFQYLSPEDIIWISMGTFRYNSNLKDYIKRCYPDSKIIYGEHFLSIDGKMRYLKLVRLDIYRKMLSFIRRYSDDVFVYLCMETSEVWKKVFDLDLNDNRDLEVLFPRR